VSTVRQDFRTVRPMRQSPRVFRGTRLSPVQRLTQVVEDVHRWLREGSDVEQKETVTSKFEQTESIKQAESIKRAESVELAESVKRTSSLKRSRTVKEALQQEQSTRRKLRRGITSPGSIGHSRGIGV
jgi:hypothetical protein